VIREKGAIFKRALNKHFKDAEQLKTYRSREGGEVQDVNNKWYFQSIIFRPSIVVGVDNNKAKNIIDLFIIDLLK
jgi:hypothetical protein